MRFKFFDQDTWCKLQLHSYCVMSWFCLVAIIVSYLINFITVSGKGVYAISETLDLVQYDVNSGEKTIIAKGPGRNDLTGESLDCFDNVNNVLYIMMTTALVPLKTGLYGYNLSNPSQEIGFIELPQIYAAAFGGAGEVKHTIFIVRFCISTNTFLYIAYIQQCVGDPNNGDVYVFGHSATNNTQQLLLKVYRNPENISDIIVDTVNEYSTGDTLLLPGEMSIFDSKRNKMWIAGEGQKIEFYFYIDAKTGNIENRVPYTQFPIYSSNYDVNLDQIVGISFDGFEPDDNAQYTMKYADPVDLNVTQQFQPFKEWCFWTAEGSIDDQDQIWYQLLSNDTESACRDSNGTGLNQYLVGVNIKNGQIETAPPIGPEIIWDLFYWNQ